MKPFDLGPEKAAPQRVADQHLPRERFGVVRIRGGVACDEGFYWAFDNLDDARRLCSFLVTEELGAYVFDTVMDRKVFELPVPRREQLAALSRARLHRHG